MKLPYHTTLIFNNTCFVHYLFLIIGIWIYWNIVCYYSIYIRKHVHASSLSFCNLTTWSVQELLNVRNIFRLTFYMLLYTLACRNACRETHTDVLSSDLKKYFTLELVGVPFFISSFVRIWVVSYWESGNLFDCNDQPHHVFCIKNIFLSTRLKARMSLTMFV